MTYLCLKCKETKTELEAATMKKANIRLNDVNRTAAQVPVHCDWKMVIVEDKL